MKWLGAMLAGPTLWAVVFVVVYAAHGIICADGLSPSGTSQPARITLMGLWCLGLLAFWPLFRAVPQGVGLRAQLPRAGLWIGLVATVFTLFPVVITSSCQL